MNKIKLAIAGLGTVGQSFVKLIEKNQEKICDFTTYDAIEIVGVSSRSKNGKDIDFNNYEWFNNPQDMIEQCDYDIFIELIGGIDIAYDLIKQSLLNGKSVITANKALMSKHGENLASIAKQNNVNIYYEASVAATIPSIKFIKQGLSGNKVESIMGILNGTCNYILTTMYNEKLSFEEVLKSAQELGYAEADPTFDIEGIDAAQKLHILTKIGFGYEYDFKYLKCEGITKITYQDLKISDKLGYKIKHVCIAENKNNEFYVYAVPTLVSKNDSFCVDGVLNTVEYKSDFAGTLNLIGSGAGGDATASAVSADLYDAMTINTNNVFGYSNLTNPVIGDYENLKSKYLVILDDAEDKSKFNIIASHDNYVIIDNISMNEIKGLGVSFNKIIKVK